MRAADGSKDVTFLHVTDPQSQNERQYNRAWASVLENAFEKYPDTDFIINSGDLVDHGDNQKQWAWMFNTGSDYLMDTYMMPASGNHEGMGTNATVNYFALPNVPEQELDSGVYYSYDYNDVHFTVLNTNDIAAIQKKLNGRMTIMGGIDSIIDRPDSTEEEIRAEARKVCEAFGPGGHFIPSITYGLPGSLYPHVTPIVMDEISKYNKEVYGVG